jgi:hypothetical protein
MQLTPLALLVQDPAPPSFFLTSSLEGLIAISVWLVPIMLGALAAVSPVKSKRFYHLLLPGFLAAIFITLMACGRLFFAGYLLAEGDMGGATLSSEDSVRFTAAAAVAYAGLLAATVTGVLSMIAAYRGEGIFAAIGWAALVAAAQLANSGITSIFDQFAGDAGSDKLDANSLAQSQIDAWSNNPMLVGVCMVVFLISRQLAHRTQETLVHSN